MKSLILSTLYLSFLTFLAWNCLDKMSASAESDTTNTPSPNSRSVQLKTFLRWNTGGQIGVKTDTNEHLTSVWCKLCAKHCEQVIKDTKIRGQAKSDVQKYICGTDFITKHNVMRHLGSAAHKTAIEYEKLCSGTDKIIDLDLDDDTDSNNSKPHFEIPLRQPTITKSFQDMSNDAYRKLLDAAYTLAVDGLPFSHFKTLVQVMKNCGARLISKYDNSNRAREFVNFLADAVREKITNVLNSVTCFSLLTDGSQARKTGSEKELAFIKVIHDGNPTFLCAALCNIDEYGDATSDNLKTSIDDIFLKTLNLSKDDYERKLISFTSDGASVNTGTKNGLIKQMRDDNRNWLIDIHCVLHRLELSVKDSLMKKSEFCGVFDFMVLIYYQFKRSGKLTRHFTKMSEIYDTRVLRFPKVHGTRFVSHQLRGLNILIENWVILGLTSEDCIKTNKCAKTTAKLQGILNKLKDYSFLCLCVNYYNIIKPLSALSLCLEKGDVIVTEVMPSLERTVSELEELKDSFIQENQKDYQKEVCEARGFHLNSSVSAFGTTEYSISKDGLRLNHGKLQADKQEKTVVTLTGIKNIEKSSSPGCGRGNSTSIDSVINCLTQRFSSFRNQDIYKYMSWVDPANWSDIDTEMDAIRWCYERFQVTLDYGKIDFSRVKSEWKDFKRTVGHFYSGVTSAVKLWQKICAYRKLQFPNLIKIVEILLCLGPSNSTVEAGFSHLTGMLSDRRLSLHHSSMEDLLLIKINNLVWTEKERNAILESAVKSYISSKRRKCELDPPASISSLEVNDHDHTDTCMDTECDNSDTDDEIDEHDNCSDIDSLWDRLID